MSGLLIAFQVPACYQWRPEVGAPAAVLATKRPERIRVGVDSAIVVLNPVADGDTLRGVEERTKRPLAIPLSQVRLLETRQVNDRQTTAIVIGVGATMALVILAATWEPF